MSVSRKKIVIIGGVAAGMSAASRARRNDPQAEITVFEKSGDVSYGSCGLPYYISDDIKDAKKLVAISAEDFREKRNIDVRLWCEGLRFDRRKKLVEVRNLKTGEEDNYAYDKLVIATGAQAIVPNLPGKNLKNVFVVRTLQDGIAVKKIIKTHKPKNAVVVGGGYIGLEMAEALTVSGVKVSVVEQLDRLVANIDKDMSALVEKELIDHGCEIYKSNGLREISGAGVVEKVHLMRGDEIPADMVIMAVGVRPNIGFAKRSGVELGQTGAIKTDARMRTNINDVYAAGDCAEAKNLITGRGDYIPLGTTANKQGRVAGDNVSGGHSQFKGVVGTAVVKIFNLEVARTGLSEEAALKLFNARSVVVKGKSRAGYYPNPAEITVKLHFIPGEGRLLGAQMIGREGAAQRINLFAAAIQEKINLQKLSEWDLAYAPPFAPVWDVVLITVNQALKIKR
jgi:NADPH-dependent 2,4-dienoyl-CoA reductase/sulfur reductase-like enzyme